MTPALRVIAPGLHTTIQDFGRPGYQRFGVPVSGALDPVAFVLANRLVGNADGTAGLEALYQGPTLAVETAAVRIAAANAAIEIQGDDTQLVPPFQSVTLPEGAQFRMRMDGATASALLAVEGGLALQPVLGSLSTYARAGLGGLEGRALREGDLLPLAKPAPSSQPDAHIPDAVLPRPTVIRILPGPQADLFDADAYRGFLANTYRISPSSDRMGMRLEGAAIRHAGAADIVSDGIAHGAVQVPGSGLPIILLADRQTTGGYPKIAVVISADLPGLGRLAPGAEIRFEEVTPEQAAAARVEARAAFEAMVNAIAPVGPRTPSEFDLLSENLVSGVVSADGC